MTYNKNIYWHILTCDIQVDDHQYYGIIDPYKDQLRRFVKYYDINSEIEFIDPSDLYYQYLDKSVNRKTLFTPYASFRLLADLIFPNLEKILYLDCDTIVNGSLSLLYETYPNKNKSYAAYVAPVAKEGFGEMISGVIVFNLNECRKKNTLQIARYNYNHEIFKFPDQEALFYAEYPDILPDEFDHIHDFRLMAPHLPTIIHFTNENDHKIYSEPKGFFFKRYPQFQHYYDTMEMIKVLK